MVLSIIVALVVVLYFLYATLIHKKNKVHEAAAGIDVQLNKRYDAIPNLLTIAAKFMEHERGLMEQITALRAHAMASSFIDKPEETIKLQNELTAKLHEFNVSVENYPDLKSNQAIIDAMEAVRENEENIAAARRFYNSAVNTLNNAVEIFPSSLIARLLKIEKAVFFEAPEAVKRSINAGDYFK